MGITKTICTESMQDIPNEICTFTYEASAEFDLRKSDEEVQHVAEVQHEEQKSINMVSGCLPRLPNQGEWTWIFGHEAGVGRYCGTGDQEIISNVPVVTPNDPPENKVSYPTPTETCVDKSFGLPIVSCNDVVEDLCIMVSKVVEDVESVEKCQAKLGAPDCQEVELSLPKQTCVALVHGYTH